MGSLTVATVVVFTIAVGRPYTMYIYIYIYKLVCMYVRMYVCTYVRMYVCTYVCMFVCFRDVNGQNLLLLFRILLRTSSGANVIRTQASIGISVERCGLVILVRIGAPSLPAEPKPKTLNLHPTP